MKYSRQGVWVVKFNKSRGDPLEFRRFFKVFYPMDKADKTTAILCKDAIYIA